MLSIIKDVLIHDFHLEDLENEELKKILQRVQSEDRLINGIKGSRSSWTHC